MRIKGTPFTAIVLLLAAAGLAAIAGASFMAMWNDDLFVPAQTYPTMTVNQIAEVAA